MTESENAALAQQIKKLSAVDRAALISCINEMSELERSAPIVRGGRGNATVLGSGTATVTVQGFTPDEVRELALAIVREERRPQPVTRPESGFQWKSPWDSGAFLEEKRKEFVGREWLFQEFTQWLATGSGQALLMQADYGIGKSAFVAALIERNPRRAIVAHYCCQHAFHKTLNPAQFVWNIAAQLADAFPAYAEQLENDRSLQDALEEADEDAASAFQRCVVSPLRKLDTPSDSPKCVVIDALDESLEFDGAQGRQKAKNLVELLASCTTGLPKWLRIFATSRKRSDVTTPISKSFATTFIDAEGQQNIRDLQSYVRARAFAGTLESKLAAAGVPIESLSEVVAAKSGGKFLYAVLTLDDLERGNLDVGDIPNLPPGMDGFYLDAFQRRFAACQRDYELAGAVLGLLAAAQEPLNRADLADVLGRSEDEIQTALSVVGDFVTNRNKHYAFNHLSLAEWLTGESDQGEPRARGYQVAAGAAHGKLATWCQREARREAAHNRDYLVRHLAAHLTQTERAAVYAQLLLDVRWLQRKLGLTDITALLNEFRYVPKDAILTVLERALRQSAHTLRRGDTSEVGPSQLPSQLLARLLHRPEAVLQTFCDRVVETAGALAKPWLRPLTASLQASDALLGTFRESREVTALVMLPDGRLASGSRDNTIKLWNLVSGQLEGTLEGHAGTIEALAVVSYGRLASGSADHTIKLWNPTSAKLEATLFGHSNSVWSLATLPDGRLASGSEDNTIKLWDLDSLQPEATLEGHINSVFALVVLHDGRLASGSGDNTVKLWDVVVPRLDATLRAHANCVWSLAVLPDGKLASGSADHTIKVWDPVSAQLTATLEGHVDSVESLAVLPRGRLASGSGDHTIKIWNPTNAQLDATLEGHAGNVWSLVGLPDGKLVSGSADRTVKLWDPSSAGSTPTFAGHAGSIETLALLSGDTLASGSSDHTVKLWNATSGQLLRTLDGHKDRVVALAMLPDGTLATGSWDHTVKLWHPTSSFLMATLRGHADIVVALAFLPDGRLASGSADGTVKLWNSTSARLDVTLLGHEDGITALAVLPGGRLASGSRDGTVKLWNLHSAKLVATLEGHAAEVRSLAVLRDGRLASGSADGAIKLWNTTDAQLDATLSGHTGDVVRLAVLPDGQLASGSWDRTIKLWDPIRASLNATFEGHTDHVTALASLPDGRLVSCSVDQTVVLWSTASAAVVERTIFIADAPVSCTCVAADPSTLIAGDNAGRVHFLRIEES